MKHPYSIDCDCHRCTKERRRRADQSQDDPRRGQKSFIPRRTSRDVANARAAYGSQRWAEERGGLIGGYETDDTYCPD